MAPRRTRWTPALYPDQFTGTALWGTLANSLTEIDADGNVIGRRRRELRAVRRRQEVGLQGPQGHHLPQWQDGDGRGRGRLDAASPGEDSKSAAKSLLKAVASVKADGAETVVFELDGGNADFPYTALRLSHADHAEEGRRLGRLAVGHPHRRLHARQVRRPAYRQPSTRTRTTSRPTRAGSTASSSCRSRTRRPAPMRFSPAKSSTWTAAT